MSGGLYLISSNSPQFQYGHAMSQPLPTGDFRWVEDLSVDDILKWDPSSDKGYYIEIDAEIPESLHDYLNDLPPFPESLEIDETFASSHTRELREKRYGAGFKCKQRKLAPNLLPKKKYKVHVAAAQRYLKVRGVFTKIWRAVEFTQSPWLRPYINFNTSMRQQATSPFAKRFYKLMVNSYFGKTMEVDKVYLNLLNIMKMLTTMSQYYR